MFHTDYTHIVLIGANDLSRALEAFLRYSAGGDGYVDPVAFEDVATVVNGTLEFTFVPAITVSAPLLLLCSVSGIRPIAFAFLLFLRKPLLMTTSLQYYYGEHIVSRAKHFFPLCFLRVGSENGRTKNAKKTLKKKNDNFVFWFLLYCPFCVKGKKRNNVWQQKLCSTVLEMGQSS